MSETLEQLRDRWRAEAAEYPVFEDPRAMGAAAAVRLCAAELDAYLTHEKAAREQKGHCEMSRRDGGSLHMRCDECIDWQPEALPPPPATPEPATERVALWTLFDAIVSVWGDVENCEEYGALAEIGDDSLCAVHRSDKLYRAILAADELLGPCPCGHARSQHHDEDTTKCRECRCEAFNLPPLPTPPTAPRETP